MRRVYRALLERNLAESLLPVGKQSLIVARVLTELWLENWRGFESHVIPFDETTILVGRNNAGKSTAIEALRVLGAVVRRFRGVGRFVAVPHWLDDPRGFAGVQPLIPELDFDEESFFHGYGRAPAAVTGTFDNGTSVTVFIGPLGEIHGIARDSDGHAVGSGGQARALGLPDLRIQPQAGPLLRDEVVLADTTVARGLASSPSIHFRNQIRSLYSQFPSFKELAEETWPDIQIADFVSPDASYGDKLALLIRDGPFTADAGLMGHGLQMWLQTMWFLTRADQTACVVLDEPDVYMHPDVQHRLLDALESRFDQVVVATHSVELITAADRRRS